MMNFRRSDVIPATDRRNFYEVEKWCKDRKRIEELLFAGSVLAKAQRVFDRFIQRCPRSRL